MTRGRWRGGGRQVFVGQLRWLSRPGAASPVSLGDTWSLPAPATPTAVRAERCLFPCGQRAAPSSTCTTQMAQAGACFPASMCNYARTLQLGDDYQAGTRGRAAILEDNRLPCWHTPLSLPRAAAGSTASTPSPVPSRTPGI